MTVVVQLNQRIVAFRDLSKTRINYLLEVLGQAFLRSSFPKDVGENGCRIQRDSSVVTLLLSHRTG